MSSVSDSGGSSYGAAELSSCLILHAIGRKKRGSRPSSLLRLQWGGGLICSPHRLSFCRNSAYGKAEGLGGSLSSSPVHLQSGGRVICSSLRLSLCRSSAYDREEGVGGVCLPLSSVYKAGEGSSALLPTYRGDPYLKLDL